MPITYEIVEDSGVIIASADGQFSGAIWLEARKRMFEDPAFRPGLNVLLDLRRASFEEAKTEDIPKGAQKFDDLASRIGHIRFAVVAGSDLAFGVSRAWGAWLSRAGYVEVNVFREMAPAQEWLGL